MAWTIFMLSLSDVFNSEGHDRTSIALPGYQEELLSDIKKKAVPGTPIIVVVMSGGPVDITAVKVCG